MSVRGWSNPLFDSQPFEELHGHDRQISPEELERFYREQEVRDVQRKISRKSKWGRKSISGRNTVGAPPNISRPSLNSTDSRSAKSTEEREDAVSVKSASTRNPPPQPVTPAPATSPTFTQKQGEWNSVAPAFYQSYYEIHNPIGPQYYLNHHLVRKTPKRPPITQSSSSQTQTTTSVPSTLSTPPITSPDSVDSLNVPPTRTRKVSLNAPQDNVDMLDGTDPWGQNFHHDSPYDVGLEKRKQESQQRPQMSRPPSTRHSPSPLSQSTSALNLATEVTSPPPANRRLSKRKPASFRGLVMSFEKTGADAPPPAPQTSEPKSGFQVVRPGSRSVPATPVTQTVPPPNLLQKSAPQASSSSLNVSSTSRREKRVSVLGKLVKKFSIMAKPVSQLVTESSTSDLEVTDTDHSQSPAPAAPNMRASSVPALSTIAATPDSTLNGKDPPTLDYEHRSKTEPLRRIAPPSIAPEIPAIPFSRPLSDIASSTFLLSDDDSGSSMPPPIIQQKEADRGSVDFSYDQMGLGKLTIANPDLPGSKPGTPVRASVALPRSTADVPPMPPPPPPRAEQEGFQVISRHSNGSQNVIPSSERHSARGSPSKGSKSVFGESRTSLQNLEVPSGSANASNSPAALSVSWPSVTDSRPSSVHVSLLGEKSDGENTPKRGNSPQKGVEPTLGPSPQVEMLGLKGSLNRDSHESDRPRSRHDSSNAGHVSLEADSSRRSSPTKHIGRNSAQSHHNDRDEETPRSRAPSSQGRRRDDSGVSMGDEERLRDSKNRSRQEIGTGRSSPEKQRSSGKERGRSRVDETYRLVRSESNGDAIQPDTLTTLTGDGLGWEVVGGTTRRSRNAASLSPEKKNHPSGEQDRDTRRPQPAVRDDDEFLLAYDRDEQSYNATAGPSQIRDAETPKRPPLSRSSTMGSIPPPPPPKSPKRRDIRLSDPEVPLVPQPRLSSLDGALPPPPLPPRAPRSQAFPSSTNSIYGASDRKRVSSKHPPPDHAAPSRAQPSNGMRPTSEYPAAGEGPGLRAKEAWEADRLLKGKSSVSVLDTEVEEYLVSPPVRQSSRPHAQEDWRAAWRAPVPPAKPQANMSIARARQYDYPPQPFPTAAPGYGSGHTSYVVPAPFMPYENGANAIYAPYRPSRTPIPAFAVEYAAEARPNPLPEPPRESAPYGGAPSTMNTQTTTEYWKHYSGLAASSN